MAEQKFWKHERTERREARREEIARERLRHPEPPVERIPESPDGLAGGGVIFSDALPIPAEQAEEEFGGITTPSGVWVGRAIPFS